jgi:hypothetical protein
MATREQDGFLAASVLQPSSPCDEICSPPKKFEVYILAGRSRDEMGFELLRIWCERWQDCPFHLVRGAGATQERQRRKDCQAGFMQPGNGRPTCRKIPDTLAFLFGASRRRCCVRLAEKMLGSVARPHRRVPDKIRHWAPA